MEQTLKCPICGNPYKVYAFYSGDQSACGQCLSKAKSIEKPGNSWPLHCDNWPQNSDNLEAVEQPPTNAKSGADAGATPNG